MKKLIIGLLLVVSFLSGVVLSDQVIHVFNKVLGSHIITKETMATELEEARHFFDLYKKKYFELKEQLEKKRLKAGKKISFLTFPFFTC